MIPFFKKMQFSKINLHIIARKKLYSVRNGHTSYRKKWYTSYGKKWHTSYVRNGFHSCGIFLSNIKLQPSEK